MKKIFTSMTCCLLMVCCVLCTSSCLPISLLLPESDTPSSSTNEIPDGATVNVTGGDNYNVTIQGGSNTTVAAANKALLSAVSIVSQFDSSNSGWIGGFGSSSGSSTSSSRGSGVIYKLDKSKGEAYVITNYHVVYNADRGISNNIKVFLYGHEDSESCAITASYVGGSLSYDIAILKITNSTEIMSSIAAAATFADSDKVAVLDRKRTG